MQSAETRDTPSSYNDATTGVDQRQWSAAIKTENNSIEECGALEIMFRPDHVDRVLPVRWIFKVKYNKDGTVERYKARCCAGGHRQRYGIDYLETFSPVVRYSTVRTLLAHAAANNMIIHNMDVDTAFLYGELPEDEPDVYMEVPDGYNRPPQFVGKPNVVARVRKSLYGLKQAPRLWNKTIDKTMCSFGFKKSDNDSCLYIRRDRDSELFVAIFVDDLIISGSSIDAVNDFKAAISQKFKMKDLGELNYVLGMEVNRTVDGSITLTQKKYMEDLLKKFGYYGCKHNKGGEIPLEPKVQLAYSDTVAPTPPGDMIGDDVDSSMAAAASPERYREIVGSLMYLMVSTRPDLAYSVGYLARYLNSYDKTHLDAAGRVLRYVASTSDVGITYKGSAHIELVGYSDADWASCTSTRRSTTGYLFMLAGGPVSWSSRLQPTIAMSSTEAEYMALSAAAQEAIALRRLCADFRIDVSKPVIIYEDNKGAIAMSQNAGHYAKTKHVDIKHHFIREKVFNNDIDVIYLQTNDMLADTLTKGLPRRRFHDLLCQISSRKKSM